MILVSQEIGLVMADNGNITDLVLTEPGATVLTNINDVEFEAREREHQQFSDA